MNSIFRSIFHLFEFVLIWFSSLFSPEKVDSPVLKKQALKKEPKKVVLVPAVPFNHELTCPNQRDGIEIKTFISNNDIKLLTSRRFFFKLHQLPIIFAQTTGNSK